MTAKVIKTDGTTYETEVGRFNALEVVENLLFSEGVYRVRLSDQKCVYGIVNGYVKAIY